MVEKIETRTAIQVSAFVFITKLRYVLLLKKKNVGEIRLSALLDCKHRIML